MSVTYDSTELVSATYIPRYVQHETAPERKINSIKLARQDGEVIIDDNFGVKFIDVAGVLTGTSQSNLEANIDSFKELISRKDKNLDISFASGTRRYVCRSISHEFNRDHFHLLHVPYKVRFLVAKGYGTDTSETTALNVSGIVASPNNQTISFSGSYDAKPRHKITITTRGNADVVRIEHVTTGEYIDVDLDGFSNGDYLEIDQENLTVKKNGATNINYRGKFPSVVIGNNSMRLTIFGSGSTQDQVQFTDDGLSAVWYDDGVFIPYQAQSFVPSQSGRVHKITLQLDKEGTPGGDVEIDIRHDNNNKPGSSFGGGVFRIAAASVGAKADKTLTLAAGASPFLIANNRYWLYSNSIALTGTDLNNFIRWYYANSPSSYLLGKAMYWKDNDQVWIDGIAGHQVSPGQNDMRFEVYMGDGNAESYSIVWQCYYTKKYL